MEHTGGLKRYGEKQPRNQEPQLTIDGSHPSTIEQTETRSSTSVRQGDGPIPPSTTFSAKRRRFETVTSPDTLSRTRNGHPEAVSLHPGNEHPQLGFFHNARNTVFNNAMMVDNSTTVVTGQPAAMHELRLRTDPDAAVDSNARHPAPSCHPKTRHQVLERLTALLHDTDRKWMMAWLFGAAGTGKSAVGQTFAEASDKQGELGAAFFFSRPNGRNMYKAVVPTLAYQLATHCPPYQLALAAKINRDHQIFDKRPSIQLKKLIIEPLAEIQPQITTRFLMLLDGVDECGANMNDTMERAEEQCELVQMIAETVHKYPDLPLFWLLCSRPEKHLQNAFAEINTICRREELVIDAKCREEVAAVLWEGFARIKKKHSIITPGPDAWPSKEDFDTVERVVSGLYVFGAAILKDIEHSTSPVRQLKSLIPFLKHVTSVSTPGSIQVMDLFYARILSDVPEDDLPTTLKIIGVLITMPRAEELSAQALCNFMRLDPNDFSSALCMVHSVINIPPPETAHKRALHLYHTSFSDFLTDPSRSGDFFIERQTALAGLIKHCLFWHQLHSNTFHSTSLPFTWHLKLVHEHDPLREAHLTWISSTENHQAISHAICKFAERQCFALFGRLSDQPEEQLLALVHNSDFRYMSTGGVMDDPVLFLNWVYDHQDPSSGFIRTKPENDEDRMLLTYMEMVTREPISPAQFPVSLHASPIASREYIFVGRKSLSIIVLVIKTPSSFSLISLNLDQKPTQDVIEVYKLKLQKVKWREHTQPTSQELQSRLGIPCKVGSWDEINRLTF